jgi:hypothetical protein
VLASPFLLGTEDEILVIFWPVLSTSDLFLCEGQHMLRIRLGHGRKVGLLCASELGINVSLSGGA